jgi:hypothetical protein
MIFQQNLSTLDFSQSLQILQNPCDHSDFPAQFVAGEIRRSEPVSLHICCGGLVPRAAN